MRARLSLIVVAACYLWFISCALARVFRLFFDLGVDYTYTNVKARCVCEHELQHAREITKHMTLASRQDAQAPQCGQVETISWVRPRRRGSQRPLRYFPFLRPCACLPLVWPPKHLWAPRRAPYQGLVLTERAPQQQMHTRTNRTHGHAHMLTPTPPSGLRLLLMICFLRRIFVDILLRILVCRHAARLATNTQVNQHIHRNMSLRCAGESWLSTSMTVFKFCAWSWSVGCCTPSEGSAKALPQQPGHHIYVHAYIATQRQCCTLD